MTKLKLEGYFPTDSASYRKVVFNVAGSALYVFDSTSPRLTPASFAPRLPAQVTRVNYAVSLDAPAPMPLEPAAADDVFEKAGSRI
jgi:acetyl esterase/lipase